VTLHATDAAMKAVLILRKHVYASVQGQRMLRRQS
jgi:hypothetical protein